jgi:hypothetical protein
MTHDQHHDPPTKDPESRAWERLDKNNERDDAVIAADDTGMVSNEAAITLIEEQEHLS